MGAYAAMAQEYISADKEPLSDIRLAPPATELLLAAPERAGSFWPENVAKDPRFLEQVQERRMLNTRLETVIARLPRPDIPLDQALEDNLIDERQIADLYESLSILLENPDYRRALLYVPFEFIPREGWSPASESLRHAIDRFKSAYMAAWNSQLGIQDVRANFVDGDVLEVEARVDDLPRVVKAVHLAPKLVEAGLLKPADLLRLRSSINDPVMRQSLDDALMVLSDIGAITAAELADIDLSPEAAPTSGTHVTAKRAAWLQQERNRKRIETAAQQFALRPKEELSEHARTEDIQAFVIGVRIAIESLADTDPEEARGIFAAQEKTLLRLWQTGPEEAKEALTVSFYHLHALGLVKKEQLSALGLSLPSLTGPASRNLEVMGKEMKVVRRAVAAIESDPELSRSVYPVALVSGSRLKGYSNSTADMDVAVLMRPEASFEDRHAIRTKLKEKFSLGEMGQDIMELWLETTPNGLAIRDLSAEDPLVGDHDWTNVLFGAAWEGENQAIKELREKLLVPYFHNAQERRMHLEGMERDTLQYRLMHRGYARFFPPRGSIRSAHANRIDGHSMFWDSGYRQTAIQLFASRVFLPKLESRT